MAGYRVFFKRSVEKDLVCLPKKDVMRILDRIKTLEENPRPSGCEKLAGQERYRLRQGHYRIVYSIQDNELTVPPCLPSATVIAVVSPGCPLPILSNV